MHDYYAPAFEVKIEGLAMEADVSHAVIDLTYESSLDTADMVTLRLNNADMRFTDSTIFNVGKNVEVYMGYAGDLQPMMLGEITAISPEFPESGAPTLTVTAYDKSYRLRQKRKERTFLVSNPSVIALQIAAENLLIPVVEPTPIILEQYTQQGSDMDTLQELADRTFFNVYVDWDRLHFEVPRPQNTAICLEWGKNLSSFSPRLSTSGQVGAISVLGYDNELAQTIVGLVPVMAADFDVEVMVERLGRTVVDQLISMGVQSISGERISSYVDAAAFAKSLMTALLEGLFEGHGTCIGIPDLRAGKMVEIAGVGKRFSGMYRISRATHAIGAGGYRTSFEITQRNSGTVLQLMRRYLGARERKRRPGTMVAKVISNMDPKNLGRLLVIYPGLGGKVQNWAKVVPADRGTYFMPDIGDDVEVVFEEGNIDRPKIIGISWNVQQMPPELPTPTNFKRVIKSRAGHIITLDDTPGGGGIRLSTLAGSEVYVDGSGNVEIMSGAAGGISLKSPIGAEILLDQQGNISINGEGHSAARKQDKVVSTSADDQDFWGWLKGLVEVLKGIPVPVPEPVPTSLTGKIVEGSTTVKIGG